MPGQLVLIAGAGDVGRRAARLCADRGDEVLLLRRRDAEPPAGTRAVRGDLATGEGLARLPRAPQQVLFCPAPDERSDAAYRALYVDGARRLLDALGEAPARFVFVGSTAVYAEDAGEWVDEATPPRPPAFNGRRLLEAEATLRGILGRSAVALRLTGLYGPGRAFLLRRALAGEPAGPHWGNRIHVDDAAAACAHLLAHPRPSPTYLGSDDRPTREDEILPWLRARAGLDPVPPATGPETGRRVRNLALRESGWTPAHPDYRSGYGPLLDAHLGRG